LWASSSKQRSSSSGKSTTPSRWHCWVVGFVEFDELAVEVVGGVDVFGAQALLFGVVDEVLEIFRRVLFVVDIQALHQTFDRGELVGGIEDLEGGGQAGVAVMGAQHAVTEAVEGADPHASCVDGEERLQARHHFAGGFVGEGDREDGGWRCQTLLDEPRDAGDQDAGFAAARAGQNQRRFVRERYRGVLFGVQVVEEFGHFPEGRRRFVRHYKVRGWVWFFGVLPARRFWWVAYGVGLFLRSLWVCLPAAPWFWLFYLWCWPFLAFLSVY
jgi:hypothetical protein